MDFETLSSQCPHCMLGLQAVATFILGNLRRKVQATLGNREEKKEKSQKEKKKKEKRKTPGKACRVVKPF